MIAFELRGICDLSTCETPLQAAERKVPEPGPGMVLLKVSACGVCHTELDEIEGRTPPPLFPVVPGHQVVGRVVGSGPGADRFSEGDRVGVGWFFSSCGSCIYCSTGRENLCPDYRATGRDADGGYAEYMTVPESSAAPIPALFGDIEAAPLLCAGAVGYRSLCLAHMRDGMRLGLTGFGASGHLVLKMARYSFPSSPVYVFARDPSQREFALGLGAAWAGDTTDRPPEPPDRIIDTTPAWKPVVEAMASLAPGGRLVINAIRKESGDRRELLDLDYARHLWMEKEMKSVANVCRSDISGFLEVAAAADIRPQVTRMPLQQANQAILRLRSGGLAGSIVLTP